MRVLAVCLADEVPIRMPKLRRALEGLGHQVDELVLRVPYGGWGGAKFVRQLRMILTGVKAALRTRGYDIIHLMQGWDVCLLPFLLNKTPKVYDARNTWGNVIRVNRRGRTAKVWAWIADRVMTALVRRCDHVAIVDSHIAQMVLRAKPRRWSYLRNLPERSFLRTTPPERERVKNLVFGYIGGVSLERNVHSMLLAWKPFAEQHPDCRLKIVGIVGGNQRYFTQRIQPLLRELRNTVEFRGPIPYDQVPGFFRSIDISVSPSRDDHLQLRVGESLASRVPTVMRWGPYRSHLLGDKGIVYFRGARLDESDEKTADALDARALCEAYDWALHHIDSLRHDVWARQIRTWEDDVRHLADVYAAIGKKHNH